MSSFRANPYLPTRSSKIWGWGGSLVACLMSDHPGVATSLLLGSTGHSHPRGSEVRRLPLVHPHRVQQYIAAPGGFAPLLASRSALARIE